MSSIAAIGSAQPSFPAQQLSGLRGEIKSAVRSALEESGGTGDPHEVVRSAINGVLEKHGIDPEEFKAQMESMREKRGMPRPEEFGAPPAHDLEGGGDKIEEASRRDFLPSLLDIVAGLEAGQDRLREETARDRSSGFLVNQVA